MANAGTRKRTRARKKSSKRKSGESDGNDDAWFVVIIANNKQPALVAKFGHFYSLNIQSLMCLAWPCLCASYVDVAIH